MASVHWPDETLSQLADIIAYIDDRNPAAAAKIGARLLALGNSLTSSPNRGRPRSNGTRQLVTVRPYILTYRVMDDEVVILSIRHGARRPIA